LTLLKELLEKEKKQFEKDGYNKENCLIKPLGVFGEHWKGYFGCIWCKLRFECMKESPWKGKSEIFEGEEEKVEVIKERIKIIRPAKVKPIIPTKKLKGFFTPS